MEFNIMTATFSQIRFWPSLLIDKCSCLRRHKDTQDLLINIFCPLEKECRFILLKKLFFVEEELPTKKMFLGAMLQTGVFSKKQIVSIFSQVYAMSSLRTANQALENFIKFLREKRNFDIDTSEGFYYFNRPITEEDCQ